MNAKKSRIMYIEDKSADLNGLARIGRVTFSKSGRTLQYGGRTFEPFNGYKANFRCVETGDQFWISGPRKDGRDRLYERAAPSPSRSMRTCAKSITAKFGALLKPPI